MLITQAIFDRRLAPAPIFYKVLWRLGASLLLLLCIDARTLAQVVASEYEVKAAFLLNFMNYVEWPAEAPAQRVCILGDDPFGATFDSLVPVRGEVQGVSVERIDSARAGSSCRIVFISRGSASAVQRDLAQLQDLPVLTVGEGDTFIEAGGMIAFRLEQDRVKLTINPGAANRAGLKISSRLLGLARIAE